MVSKREVGPVTHFKGSRYVVLGLGVHTETGDHLVVYRPAGPMADQDFDFYLRPEQMFDETVPGPDGTPVPRFTTIDRTDVRTDVLTVSEDMLANGELPGTGMSATRSLLDAQRTQAVGLLGQVAELAGSGDDDLMAQADQIVEGVAAMLRLLDAAEAEVDTAESMARERV